MATFKHIINSFLTEAQRNELEAYIKVKNISKSQVIRNCLLQAGAIQTYQKPLRRSGRKLGRTKLKFYKIPEDISNIVTIVCNTFKVSARDVYSSRRYRALCNPRHCIRYVLRAIDEEITLKSIASKTNHSDHSTVIHSLYTFRDILDTESDIKSKYSMIVRQLNKIGYNIPKLK